MRIAVDTPALCDRQPTLRSPCCQKARIHYLTALRGVRDRNRP
jgi:hypothetical protein